MTLCRNPKKNHSEMLMIRISLRRNSMVERLKLLDLGQKKEQAFEDINERTRGVNRPEWHDHPCFRATSTESTA